MNPCYILTFLFALRAETFKIKVNVCFFTDRDRAGYNGAKIIHSWTEIKDQLWHFIDCSLLLFSGGFGCDVYCYFVYLRCLILTCSCVCDFAECVCVLGSDGDELMNVLLLFTPWLFFFTIIVLCFTVCSETSDGFVSTWQHEAASALAASSCHLSPKLG